MLSPALFSSNTEEWYTPMDFFEQCAREVGGFDLDPCATHENAKCSRYFTKEDDGLTQEWSGRVFVNPPYGRAISAWVAKCAKERVRGGADVIYLLIPSRTDTAYFHDHLYQKEGVELRFLRGRLKFVPKVDKTKLIITAILCPFLFFDAVIIACTTSCAPFPSLLAIFRP